MIREIILQGQGYPKPFLILHSFKLPNPRLPIILCYVMFYMEVNERWHIKDKKGDNDRFFFKEKSFPFTITNISKLSHRQRERKSPCPTWK